MQSEIDAVPSGTGKPPHIPDKFWDPATGQVRLDALLRSYQELERKLSVRPSVPQAVPSPDPAAPSAGPELGSAGDDSAIRTDPDLVPVDPRVNAYLRRNGFGQDQIQLVYDLGCMLLKPLADDMQRRIRCRHDLERLDGHFGDASKRMQACTRLDAWGRNNLPQDLYASMASSYDGVLALEKLAALSGDEDDEPRPLRGGRGSGPLSEGQLKALMRDPKYWRDGDPDIVARVRNGFRALYPG